MREDAFRAWLTTAGYTGKSVASRLSRCRAVERRLCSELDQLDLGEDGVSLMRAKLDGPGVTAGVLADQLNAVRTYARFAGGEAPARQR